MGLLQFSYFVSLSLSPSLVLPLFFFCLLVSISFYVSVCLLQPLSASLSLSLSLSLSFFLSFRRSILFAFTHLKQTFWILVTITEIIVNLFFAIFDLSEQLLKVMLC